MSRERFSMAPLWLLAMIADGDLPGQVMLTYIAINKYVRYGTNEEGVWPSQATLAKDTGLTDRSVREHLRIMEAAGVITRTARSTSRGRSSDLITLARKRPPTGSPLPLPPGSGLPGNKNQLNETPSPPDSLVVVPPPDLTTQPTSAPIEPDSPPVPNETSSVQRPPAELPLVRRRQLIGAGVTNESGPLWEQAWLTVTSMQWPDGLDMEAANYPDEHLAQHIFQSLERGFALSPSRWVQFYISDRQDQIRHALARLEQEARFAEDPAEREARQNSHLPPDRSNEFPPPPPAGVQP